MVMLFCRRALHRWLWGFWLAVLTSCSAAECKGPAPSAADNAVVQSEQLSLPPSDKEQLDQGRRRLALLGDSLTSGYGLAESESYPVQLQRLLDNQGFEWDVLNAGVSGDTTQGGLERLEWVLETQPDLLVVSLGANDGLRGLALEVTEKNLTAIVAGAKSRKVPVLLTGMRMPANYGAARNAEYEAVFERVSKAENVPLLPFLIEGVALKPEHNQPDGIHPNASGARLIAEHVFAFVSPFLGPAVAPASEVPGTPSAAGDARP